MIGRRVCETLPASACAFHHLFPQTLDVAHGWKAEQAFLLAVLLGDIVISYTVGRAFRIEVFGEEVWPRRQCFQDLAEVGQLEGGTQVVR